MIPVIDNLADDVHGIVKRCKGCGGGREENHQGHQGEQRRDGAQPVEKESLETNAEAACLSSLSFAGSQYPYHAAARRSILVTVLVMKFTHNRSALHDRYAVGQGQDCFRFG